MATATRNEEIEVIHSSEYLFEVGRIADQINFDEIESMVDELIKLRARRGRLFFIGLGGSAANCSHAVNDFRKLCGIEAYAPTDNVAEITARANDEGIDTLFSQLFLRDGDALFVLSVGGGTDAVSTSISKVVSLARASSVPVFGIVGKDSGYTARMGTSVIVVPTVERSRITPHTEAFQSVILHCIVSHPDLQRVATKW